MEKSETQYIELYEQCQSAISGHSCDVLNAHRQKAYDTFKAKGLPTRKVEEYKYTSMQELFAPDLGLNINRLQLQVNPYDAFKCDVPNLSTQLYFVVNDQFCSEARPKTELPEGVIVDSFCNVAKNNPELLTKYYNCLADSDPVSALNTMLAQDGLLIYVPKGVVVDKVLQVVNVLAAPSLKGKSDNEPDGLMVNRRVIVVAEERASVKVLFCDHTADDVHFITTQVMEVYAADDASVEIYGLEETHQKNTLVANTYIEQQRSSRVNHSLITLHNGKTRQQTRLKFAGEGAECWLNGGVIADKEQRVDNNTLIDHAVPHCDSHELYKYVLDNDAVGAFAGRVLVREGAQQTTSDETNQNLLATKTARMYTQPMLEIYADDVKCSHGSTVGQLNDKALFYMQQRGISLKEARLLLQTAFITEVVDQIPLEPLRDRLHYLIDKRFRGELSKCKGCKLCK